MPRHHSHRRQHSIHPDGTYVEEAVHTARLGELGFLTRLAGVDEPDRRDVAGGARALWTLRVLVARGRALGERAADDAVRLPGIWLDEAPPRRPEMHSRLVRTSPQLSP